MFEKLLSLLLQAKGGAVATVFVLGTTGALVTATVDNGLTTVTITQPSSTTTGSETTTTPDGSTTTNTTVAETILALFTRTRAEDDPTETAKGNGCSDEAHARNGQIERVNEASKAAREAAKALGKDAPRRSAARELVEDVDEMIRDIRRAAVKAIHRTFDCDKEDEDQDAHENEDQDVDDQDVDVDQDDKDEDRHGHRDTTVAFSGDDATVIADLAIAAMNLQVTNLETELAKLTTDERDLDDERDNDKRGHDKRDRDDDDDDDKRGDGRGHSQFDWRRFLDRDRD